MSESAVIARYFCDFILVQLLDFTPLHCVVLRHRALVQRRSRLIRWLLSDDKGLIPDMNMDSSRRHHSAQPSPYPKGTGGLFHRGKRPQHETEHSLLSIQCEEPYVTQPTSTQFDMCTFLKACSGLYLYEK